VAAAGSAYQREVSGAWAALAAARTNGALFLAIPDGAAGTDVADDRPVAVRDALRGDQRNCVHRADGAPVGVPHGAGTWPRVGGLLLIAAARWGCCCCSASWHCGCWVPPWRRCSICCWRRWLARTRAGRHGRDTFRAVGAAAVGALLSKLVYSVALVSC